MGWVIRKPRHGQWLLMSLCLSHRESRKWGVCCCLSSQRWACILTCTSYYFICTDDMREWRKTVCKLCKIKLFITSQQNIVFNLHWLKHVIQTGVIPFHGFSMYGEYVMHLLMCCARKWYITDIVCVCPTVAPLCFLYNEPSKLYSVFREMYIRHFFRLHSISSSPSVSFFVCGCSMLWSKYSVCVYICGYFIQLHMCFCRV